MKNIRALIFVLIVAAVPITWVYTGHFLFSPQKGSLQERDSGKKTTKAEDTGEKTPPVLYRHISTQMGGKKQEINLLEVDLRKNRAVLKPVLSYDSVFGFEKLSLMVERSKAYAAINAGFFYEFGNPSGMVAIDGRLVTLPTGKYPVLMITGGKAELREQEIKLFLDHNNVKTPLDGMNTLGDSRKAVVYTRDFGTDNRAKTDNLTIVVEDDTAVEVLKSSAKTDIPKSGYVITFYGAFDAHSSPVNIQAGDKLSISINPEIGKDIQGYECGSWIVRDGKNIAGESDEWVGVLTNNDPRTAAGIKSNGNVLLVTVDGRQPGYSEGVTAKELGELLLEYGAVDAAMLDGGASTEMIVEGKIVNRPSFRGQERMLGGALIVKTIDNLYP